MATFLNLRGTASLLSVLIVAGLTAVPITFAQRVEERDGSIYLIGQSGAITKITEGNNDSSPALSADRAKVVYLRTYASNEPGSDGSLSEIRCYQVSTRRDQSILRAPTVIDGQRYFGFGSPQFSADGLQVFFLFDWSVTTHGLASVGLRTRSVKFLMPAVTFFSVLRGKYAGNLVVQQRRPKLSTGFFYLYYLFSPAGKELGVVGENQFDVDLFLDPDGSH
jgi:hypothetical protein